MTQEELIKWFEKFKFSKPLVNPEKSDQVLLEFHDGIKRIALYLKVGECEHNPRKGQDLMFIDTTE